MMEISQSYKSYIEELKSEISKARVKAVLSVNKELILLYWKIGNKILDMQEREGWGTQVINQISRDLKNLFPEMKSFGARNLVYMRTFSNTYSNTEFTQQPIAQIPWGHHCTLLDKLKINEERFWYIQKTIERSFLTLINPYRPLSLFSS